MIGGVAFSVWRTTFVVCCLACWRTSTASLAPCSDSSPHISLRGPRRWPGHPEGQVWSSASGAQSTAGLWPSGQCCSCFTCPGRDNHYCAYRHGLLVHLHANNSELYLAFRSTEAEVSVVRVERCVNDIKSINWKWMMTIIFSLWIWCHWHTIPLWQQRSCHPFIFSLWIWCHWHTAPLWRQRSCHHSFSVYGFDVIDTPLHSDDRDLVIIHFQFMDLMSLTHHSTLTTEILSSIHFQFMDLMSLTHRSTLTTEILSSFIFSLWIWCHWHTAPLCRQRSCHHSFSVYGFDVIDTPLHSDDRDLSLSSGITHIRIGEESIPLSDAATSSGVLLDSHFTLHAHACLPRLQVSIFPAHANRRRQKLLIPVHCGDFGPCIHNEQAELLQHASVWSACGDEVMQIWSHHTYTVRPSLAQDQGAHCLQDPHHDMLCSHWVRSRKPGWSDPAMQTWAWAPLSQWEQTSRIMHQYHLF